MVVTGSAADESFVGRRWAVEQCLNHVRTPRQTLLMHGPPASGKTTLARRVHQSLDARDSVVVLHECHANDDATLLPRRLIDLIVRALCARSAEYTEALAATLGRPIEISSEISMHDTDEDPDYDELEDNIAASVLNADRQFAAELVRGGHPDAARDVVLGMARLGGELLRHHVNTMWTIAGATELTRVSISARAAAECGFSDVLERVLASGHDRSSTAAWVAERMLDAPAWHTRPGNRQAILMLLCANALDRRDAATTTLAHLVMAAPAAATSIEPARWLDVLRRTGGP